MLACFYWLPSTGWEIESLSWLGLKPAILLKSNKLLYFITDFSFKNVEKNPPFYLRERIHEQVSVKRMAFKNKL